MTNFSLTAISPIDGRYSKKTKELSPYFSEAALIKHRLLVEALYLIKLLDFLKKDQLKEKQKKALLNWVKNLKLEDLVKVKKIEAEIKHDVKAVEYFLKLHLKKINLDKVSPWVHWGLTSEDVNNLSYGLILQGSKDKIIIPIQLKLIKKLVNLAQKYADLVMLGRTHGQIAVPTTLGKELIVFASRGSYFLKKIMALKIEAKLNGAVGNYNSFYQIYPDKNWLKFSQDFIKSFSLNPNLITTQIEPNSSLVYYLDLLRQLNNVWLDLAKDSWLYISFNYFFQKRVRKEIGSSTMPHKINPINFENAEGNFELSNSLLSFMANKLPLSRLQRDLSDSTIKRNLGIVFSYSLLGVKSLIKGLNKIKPNQEQIKKDLNSHPEVLSEALQLFFKTKGRKKAYEKVKLQTRGKKISWKDLIKSSSPKDKKVLSSWQVSKYTGLASFLTIKEIKNIKNKLKI